MCVCCEGKSPQRRDGKTLEWKRFFPPPPQIASTLRLYVHIAGMLNTGKTGNSTHYWHFNFLKSDNVFNFFLVSYVSFTLLL